MGRVCFDLAQNKREPELPFAFPATYAPRISRDGRAEYRPPGKALQECAGSRNRQARTQRARDRARALTEKEAWARLDEKG